MTRSVLLLWDIDHTLIQTGGVGREVFADAFERVVGQPMREMADPSGLTEPAIFERTLMLHGAGDPNDYFPAFAERQAAGYRDRADEMLERGKVLAGAAEALREFQKRPDVMSSVLTGNTRASALAKLEIFRLDGYLDLACGAFGDDDHDRAMLVRLAWRRAEKHRHLQFGSDDTLIIGDTPNDVLAARANGAYAVGVTSGKFDHDALSRAGADVVLPDLADLERLQAVVDAFVIHRGGARAGHPGSEI